MINEKSFEFEKIVLSSIFVSNDVVYYINGIITESSFSDTLHKQIFIAILKLADSKKHISSANVISMLEGCGVDNYREYVRSLEVGSMFLDSDYAVEYAKQIHDIKIKSELIKLLHKQTDNIKSSLLDISAHEIICDIEDSLITLSGNCNISKDLQLFPEFVKEFIEQINSKDHKPEDIVKSGLLDLDDLLGGFKRSDLIIVAGRPSMGKTSFATSLAFNAAIAGKCVVFFSLEMSCEQVSKRLISLCTGRPAFKFGTEIDRKNYELVLKNANKLEELNIFIDDKPLNTIAGILATLKRFKLKYKHIDLVVIDYLQLLSSSKRGYDNRVQEITEITKGLKAIAREMDVPLITLSQLSRATEQREDKRPQLSDLRDSGSIEQDADIVMLLFREEYYLQRQEPRRREAESDEDFQVRHDNWQDQYSRFRGIAEVIVAKHRNGPIGVEKVRFDTNIMKFTNLEVM